MMKEMLKNKKWIYRILICSFILTSLLFIFINTTKEINISRKKQEDYAYKMSKILNVKLEFLHTVIADFKNTQPFRNYLDNDTNSFYYINVLYKELIKRNNIYGKLGYVLSVTKEDSNIVITPRGTKNKNEYYKELGLNLKNNSLDYLSISEKNNQIHILLKTRDLIYRKNIFWIISFEKDIFFQYLNSDNNNKNWYLYHKNLYSLVEKSYDNSFLDKILKNINKKNRNIIIFPESNFHFSIIYIKNKINYLEIILKESFKTSILFGIFGFFIIYILKSLENPIKELAKKVKLITGNSSKNEENSDIEYIEQQITELNDIKNILEEKIDHLDIFAKKKLLKDYMLGISEPNLDDKKLLEEITEIGEVNKRICLLEVFDVETLEENYENFIKTKEYIFSKLQDYSIHRSITIDYKSLVLIIDARDNSILEEQLKEFLDSIEEKFQIKFVAAISDLMKNIEELPKMYRTCKKILEYKFIFKPNNILFYYKINKKQLNSYYYPIEIESKLVSKVLNGNAIGVKKIVDKIFGEKIEYNKMAKDKVMEFSALLYNTLQRIILQLHEFYGDKKTIDLNIEKIYRISDIVILKETFLSILLDICKLTKTEDQNDGDIVKIKIRTYLEENYSKDLSLENLADYLGHSFKYTSILFKKIMGDNFKNYLNSYRMSKAKELMLSNKNLKIKDIALLVGCNSSNTFIRIFRKYEGVSPTQYISDMEDFENNI